jgi:hypothetical protein
MRLAPVIDAEAARPQQPPDFSLVLGGPLFQLYRRAHLSGDALELLRRRILVITLFAWLPLLLLAALEGHILGGSIKISFLRDIEAHIRFLIALPVLVAAELVVHLRLVPVVRRFVERQIVVADDWPQFNTAVNSALRLRNSVSLEISLLVLVYTLGHWLWRSGVASGSATWYAIPDPMHLNLTWAGYWYAFVSIPIFQFILLRWYMRLMIWFRFLWQVSRLNLHLTAAHPDRAGGIGFVGDSSYAFAPLLFAQGALLAGLIASRVLYEGRNLLSFKMQAACFIGFFVVFILAPLVIFTPRMARIKRKCKAEYGLLANRYVFEFEKKWIRGGPPEAGELLGTGDIQSLADLGNSYLVVREMRIVPFALEEIGILAAATAAPLLPLMLTILSPEELLTGLVKILFR